MRRRFLSYAAVLSLVACVPAAVDEPAAVLPRVDVQEMNVSFSFHEQLTLRASQEEALLSGPTTRMQVQTLPYGKKKPPPADNQLAEWALPKDVADRVRDERSCAPLKDASVFLPVRVSRARCDLVLDPSGRPVVWMVGLGRPFQDVPFMQSSFLVLEDERFHLFSYVYPFPESDATVQWLTDTFRERNPNMSRLYWGNKSFLLLVDEAETALGQQIDPSSDEVQYAMDALRDLAFSVGPYRESGGR